MRHGHSGGPATLTVLESETRVNETIQIQPVGQR